MPGFRKNIYNYDYESYRSIILNGSATRDGYSFGANWRSGNVDFELDSTDFEVSVSVFLTGETYETYESLGIGDDPIKLSSMNFKESFVGKVDLDNNLYKIDLKAKNINFVLNSKLLIPRNKTPFTIGLPKGQDYISWVSQENSEFYISDTSVPPRLFYQGVAKPILAKKNRKMIRSTEVLPEVKIFESEESLTITYKMDLKDQSLAPYMNIKLLVEQPVDKKGEVQYFNGKLSSHEIFTAYAFPHKGTHNMCRRVYDGQRKGKEATSSLTGQFVLKKNSDFSSMAIPTSIQLFTGVTKPVYIAVGSLSQ